MLWPAAYTSVNITKMFKNSGTEVVQKDTKVDLVVVPKVTSISLWYRNGLALGPERDRYRT